MKIADKTFIVTGGASGLGEATVRELHGAGARVVIADLNGAAGERLADELGAASWYQHTDVTDAASAVRCVDAAVSHFGGVAGLIGCAGIGTAGRVLGRDGPQPLPDFSRVVAVNLIGCFNMLRVAAAVMSDGPAGPDGERGVIVNTASVAAFDGQIGQAAYAASKGGIVAMTLPIARELARFGVRVTTIAPGLFLTPMMETLPQDIQRSLGESVPFPQRLGRPAEFAALVRHIVENPMLNGETIRLDGALRLPPR